MAWRVQQRAALHHALLPGAESERCTSQVASASADPAGDGQSPCARRLMLMPSPRVYVAAHVAGRSVAGPEPGEGGCELLRTCR